MGDIGKIGEGRQVGVAANQDARLWEVPAKLLKVPGGLLAPLACNDGGDDYPWLVFATNLPEVFIGQVLAEIVGFEAEPLCNIVVQQKTDFMKLVLRQEKYDFGGVWFGKG